MDDPIIKLANQLTAEIERFLKACQQDGDVTIEDVLKRLRNLRQGT